MDIESISMIISKTRDMGCKYRIYTNGTLISDVPSDFFTPFEVIFVSLDGDREAHDKYRGRGTYDKIMKNIQDLRRTGCRKIIGRITVEEETNLYESVNNLIGATTDIYWQIVNKPRFSDARAFVMNYNKNMEQLLDLWIGQLRWNSILNLIPFQSVVSQLLFSDGEKRNVKSFRCGAGNGYQAIDLEGNIYWCDEYVGGKKGIIGHISEMPHDLHYLNHKDIFVDCQECDIEDVCLGRCRKCLSEYTDDHIRNYCIATRHMVTIIKRHLKEIRSIVQRNHISPGDLYPAPHCTEEIP